MKVKYRDHRGSLDESLKTIKEFESVTHLQNYLNESYEPFDKKVELIKIEKYGFDPRINWDSYIVLIQLTGDEEFIPVGFTDGNFPITDEKILESKFESMQSEINDLKKKLEHLENLFKSTINY